MESCSRKKNNKRTWKDITYATNHWRGETLGYWAQFLPCRAATRPTQHRLLAFKFSRELALRHREINLFAVQFCESVIKQLYSFELSGRSFSSCFRNCKISHFSSHFSFFFLYFLFQDFTRSIFGREAFVKSLYPLPLSPFISFQIFTRSIFRRVFSKDYDRIDLNAFLVRLARLLNRLFFLPSRNPSLIDRSLTISNLHLPPFPINSPLQIAPSQCFKLRRCKNTTKPSLRFLLINLSKRKRKKENNGAENKNRTLYPENRERNIYIYRKIGRFQKINVERGGAEISEGKC